ncbi:hypothetical protein B0H17DRAFT_570141 [Mycena rosella]|uniref:NACHT-NTPase and P-loop NTPases N-terminal domain-containing protein n=1 Tax=Mycena rosella TaxID=1033263 RepID=A0AAD7GWJ7_MYCRO|nr:hypothetical protein B0H17DRAFT_570141 [Mycena rosella]
MADIVGLVASVLQLVDTMAKARGYIKDFRDAPKDQQRLLLEIQNLEPLVKELDTRIKEIHTAGQLIGMTEFEEPLVQLKGTMERLTKKLDSTGISKFSSRVTWPLWGKEDVEEGLDTIERFKSLLNAWLGMDIWKSAQDINLSIQDVAEEQRVDHGYVIRSVKQLAQEYGVAHNETISIIKDATEEQRTDLKYISKSAQDIIVSIKDITEEQSVNHGYTIRSVKQLAKEHRVAYTETISNIKDATEEQRTEHICRFSLHLTLYRSVSCPQISQGRSGMLHRTKSDITILWNVKE